MRIKGTLKMFVFTTEDDGARIHANISSARRDRRDMQECGANGITEIEEIDLILDSFEITEAK
jgi:hypothetical protein